MDENEVPIYTYLKSVKIKTREILVTCEKCLPSLPWGIYLFNILNWRHQKLFIYTYET